MSATILHQGSVSLRFVGGQFSRIRPSTSIGPSLSKWHRSNSTSSNVPPAQEPIIFSGIQPTGVPHLGNYLGALREWVKLQDEAKPGTKLLFSIVDLHALTVPQDAVQLRKWRREAFATLLAVGLDPSRSTVFYQSEVCASRGVSLWRMSELENGMTG
jgi:tryptophanyl-tRNA synthetase